MPDQTHETLKENAAAPAEVSIDGQTVKQHPLRDQIDADRYAASKAAVRKGLGVRMVRVAPPGAS